MAGTRSSARIASKQDASPQSTKTASPSAGSKRKASNYTGPKNKRGKKEQKTIEETLPDENGEQKDQDMKDQGAQEEQAETSHEEPRAEESIKDKQEDGKEPPKEDGDAQDKSEPSKEDAEVQPSEQDQSNKEPASTSNGALEKDPKRAEELPSNILERGIIYFFARGRVNVDDPSGVNDIARSYIVLRPIPDNVKLGEGPLEDLKNNRLLALPKKVLPRSHKDQFMVFVEKAKTTIQDLKDNFISGSDYETKTTGVRHTPAATPVGEGVYSITQLGRNSRLAYMLTLPEKPEAVQDEIGLADKGSFLVSVKNPEQDAPANTSLPQGPEYPKEIIEEFAGRRWLPDLQPKHLDYPNAQLLMIGEGFGELKTAAEPTEEDGNSEKKEAPGEEMEKLEAEDEQRVEALHGEHAIYQDLGISKQSHQKLKTTW